MLSDLQIEKKFLYQLRKRAKDRNLDFLCTPFDDESLKFLTSDLKLDTIKISSGDITNAPLLINSAQLAKHVILSTGVSNAEEVGKALSALLFGFLNCQGLPTETIFENLLKSPKNKVTLLHCTSEYPAPFEDLNLHAINTLNKKFSTRVGFSDHSEGIIASLGAVSLGAEVIEKHFTLDKNLEGPDHKASLEPNEFKNMVDAIRILEKTFGNGIIIPKKSELKNKNIIRKFIVAKNSIKKGDIFTSKNLTVKRSGKGINPFNIWKIYGLKSDRDYLVDDIIKLKNYEELEKN